MSKYLPYGEFKQVKNVDELDIMLINEKNDVGYILEVGLKYPKELHELLNDIHLLQKNLLLQMIYFQTILKVLLINMR